MKRFGFIIHPLEVSDIARKFPFSKVLADGLVEKMIKLFPPFKASHITGVKSKLGTEAEGWFVCCPLTSKQMVELPSSKVTEEIIKAVNKAKNLGAEIVGLGAFTSVVGDKGITIAKEVDIPITTGNSYTVATALDGIKMAGDIMGINMKGNKILILGATGSIGRACTKILARHSNQLMLVARDKDKVDQLVKEIKGELNNNVKGTTNLNDYLKEADIIIAASSSTEALIDIQRVKSGAIICDIARPRDVAAEVIKRRNDILVIDGGIVKIPGDVEFNLDFGFPKRTAYACMAETIILALEGFKEDYSLGSYLDLEKIININKLATKHGFKLASLRSMEREITLQQVNRVRRIVNST